MIKIKVVLPVCLSPTLSPLPSCLSRSFFSLLLVVPLLLGNSTQLIQLTTSNLGVCNVRLKEFQGLNGICIEFEWPSSVLQSTLLLHFICSFRYSKNIYFKYSANQASLNSSYLVFFNTISFKRIDSIQ